ncbi:MAG: diguanylate cyclase [Pelagimonas sp.]|jgi:two-component system cell cycle response regulator|nr:diguanylate cyclase [Pelagimonas sp.]
MSGRILIVDAVPTNRIILRVKLSAALFEVAQAASGHAAVAMVRKTRPDLVLTASDLPDMSGRALCATLQRDPTTGRPPIVVIHGEDEDDNERLVSLAAGVDDILTRPIDDLVMMARLRSLLRARNAETELQLRDDTRRALGIGMAENAAEFEMPARVRLIPTGGLNDPKGLANTIGHAIRGPVDLIEADDAMRDPHHVPDVVVIAEGPYSNGEGLALLPQLRTSAMARYASVIYIAQPHLRAQAAQALDLGANDILTTGPDTQELPIRLKKQISRKRTNDLLRANMRDGLQAAVSDPLTGLFNRRYTLPHLTKMSERAALQRQGYALLVADLDHFKQVNDTYGHGAGDAVLVEFAQRLRENLRAADLMARWGGEEFLIAMPDTGLDTAKRTAERLCELMSRTPIRLPDGREIRVTLSVGVAINRAGDSDDPRALIEQADQALYAAKANGRNMVVLADRVTPLPIRTTATARAQMASDGTHIRHMRTASHS